MSPHHFNAGDLRLPSYQHLYWHDFPESAALPAAANRASQLSPALLERLNVGALIPPGARPLCIHSHLTAIITRLSAVSSGAVEPFPILGPPLSSATEVRRPAYMYTLYCTHLVHRNIGMHRHPVWGIRNILVRLRIPLFILIRIREPDQGSNFKLSVSGKFRVIQCCEAGAGLSCWNRSWLKSSGSGLLLCDLGVLWWQSCDNSYNQ